MKQLNVLIADDHRVVIKGLSYLLLNNYPKWQITGVANGEKVIEAIKNSKYDLLILDINMPKSEPLLIIQTLLAIQPSLRILVFSMYPEELFARRALSLGAHGYLEKNADDSEVLTAIKMIQSGRKYLSSFMTNQLLGDALEKKPLNLFESLSDREFEVFMLLIRGKAIYEISGILNVQVSTVATYKTRLLQKLKVKNLIELIQLARNHGLS